MTGTIKQQTDKGYGFIRAEDRQEYFFHRSSCIDPFENLTPGTKVEFDVAKSPKGPRAENVKLV